jgi:hypothetical protein
MAALGSIRRIARHAFGEDLSGLSVVKEAVKEEKVEEENHKVYYLDVKLADIFSKPIDWRKQLQAKN